MDDICLHESNIKSVFKTLSELVLSGKRYRIIIKIWKDKRSIDQNSLSHMWYADITKQGNERVGKVEFDIDNVKKDLKKAFLGYEVVRYTDVVTGEEKRVKRLKKTSELDSGEMHIYLQRIETWAYQNGFELRIPNDCEYRKLQDEQVK